MTRWQKGQKRAFDIIASLVGLLLFGWLIIVGWLIASIDTRRNGFFRQIRIGKDGERFYIVKLRTMRHLEGVHTTVTTDSDPRISKIGRVLRKTKIDELPQLWNVLIGKMSFVGPRPDVPGFADRLKGEDRIILTVRPGITGPASIKFKKEEALLAGQADPESFNRNVIWPEKVDINKEYIQNYSFWKDIKYILKTV